MIYDPMGDRWIVADFAFAGNGSTGPYYECIAVSKTSDPVAGGWYLYAVRADDAAHPWFPDYPKMGIWPDGLYMTANMFQGLSTFQEVRVWAFNRADLESGATLRSVVVDLNTSAYFSLLPSNLRGAPPPAGRENLLVSESQTRSPSRSSSSTSTTAAAARPSPARRTSARRPTRSRRQPCRLRRTASTRCASA